jgi:hypothetical protein
MPHSLQEGDVNGYDVQVAQGDLAGALKSYQADLAIADRLAKSDPSNAGWQRDLSVSYDKVGDVQVAQGNLSGALKSYSDSLAVRDRLALSDETNSMSASRGASSNADLLPFASIKSLSISSLIFVSHIRTSPPFPRQHPPPCQIHAC